MLPGFRFLTLAMVGWSRSGRSHPTGLPNGLDEPPHGGADGSCRRRRLHGRGSHLLPVPGESAQILHAGTITESRPRQERYRERWLGAGFPNLNRGGGLANPRTGRLCEHETIAAVGPRSSRQDLARIAKQHLDTRHIGHAGDEEEQPVERRTFFRKPSRINHKDPRCLRIGQRCWTCGGGRVEREPDERPMDRRGLPCRRGGLRLDPQGWPLCGPVRGKATGGKFFKFTANGAMISMKYFKFFLNLSICQLFFSFSAGF